MRVNKSFLDKITNESVKNQIENKIKEISEKKPIKESPKKKSESVYKKSSYLDYNHLNFMDKDKLILILPMPAPELNPNKILHWSKKYEFKKAAKQLGYESVLSLRTNKNELFNPNKSLIKCSLKIFTNRKLDDDNLEASLKSLRDGIYLGLNLDDGLQNHSERIYHHSLLNMIVYRFSLSDTPRVIDFSTSLLFL